MNQRERILSAIQQKKPDRIPSDMWATPEVIDELKKYLGVEKEQGIWSALGIDKIVNLTPMPLGVPVTPCFSPSLPPDTDIWGVEYIPKSYAEGRGVYWEVQKPSLGPLDTIEDIEQNYRFPRVDDFDFSSIVEKCETFSNYAIECGYIAPFYTYNTIRGLEKSLMDLVFNPEYAHFVISRICDFLYTYHVKLFEAAGKYIDIAQVTDDFGMQSGLMISPGMFQEFFQPHYKKFIILLKDFDIHVFHHDDGAMAPLIPKLIDLGVEILNPVQWRLQGMEPASLKKSFGKKLCFHGGVDNQEILPFGSTGDVEKEVQFLLETLASDGTGYIMAPCHNIQPITTMENIVTMYEAVNHYGVL